MIENSNDDLETGRKPAQNLDNYLKAPFIGNKKNQMKYSDMNKAIPSLGDNPRRMRSIESSNVKNRKTKLKHNGSSKVWKKHTEHSRGVYTKEYSSTEMIGVTTGSSRGVQKTEICERIPPAEDSISNDEVVSEYNVTDDINVIDSVLLPNKSEEIMNEKLQSIADVLLNKENFEATLGTTQTEEYRYINFNEEIAPEEITENVEVSELLDNEFTELNLEQKKKIYLVADELLKDFNTSTNNNRQIITTKNEESTFPTMKKQHHVNKVTTVGQSSPITEVLKKSRATTKLRRNNATNSQGWKKYNWDVEHTKHLTISTEEESTTVSTKNYASSMSNATIKCFLDSAEEGPSTDSDDYNYFTENQTEDSDYELSNSSEYSGIVFPIFTEIDTIENNSLSSINEFLLNPKNYEASLGNPFNTGTGSLKADKIHEFNMKSQDNFAAGLDSKSSLELNGKASFISHENSDVLPLDTSDFETKAFSETVRVLKRSNLPGEYYNTKEEEELSGLRKSKRKLENRQASSHSTKRPTKMDFMEEVDFSWPDEFDNKITTIHTQSSKFWKDKLESKDNTRPTKKSTKKKFMEEVDFSWPDEFEKGITKKGSTKFEKDEHGNNNNSSTQSTKMSKEKNFMEEVDFSWPDEFEKGITKKGSTKFEKDEHGNNNNSSTQSTKMSTEKNFMEEVDFSWPDEFEKRITKKGSTKFEKDEHGNNNNSSTQSTKMSTEKNFMEEVDFSWPDEFEKGITKKGSTKFEKDEHGNNNNSSTQSTKMSTEKNFMEEVDFSWPDEFDKRITNIIQTQSTKSGTDEPKKNRHTEENVFSRLDKLAEEMSTRKMKTESTNKEKNGVSTDLFAEEGKESTKGIQEMPIEDNLGTIAFTSEPEITICETCTSGGISNIENSTKVRKHQKHPENFTDSNSLTGVSSKYIQENHQKEETEETVETIDTTITAARRKQTKQDYIESATSSIMSETTGMFKSEAHITETTITDQTIETESTENKTKRTSALSIQNTKLYSTEKPTISLTEEIGATGKSESVQYSSKVYEQSENNVDEVTGSISDTQRTEHNKNEEQTEKSMRIHEGVTETDSHKTSINTESDSTMKNETAEYTEYVSRYTEISRNEESKSATMKTYNISKETSSKSSKDFEGFLESTIPEITGYESEKPAHGEHERFNETTVSKITEHESLSQKQGSDTTTIYEDIILKSTLSSSEFPNSSKISEAIISETSEHLTSSVASTTVEERRKHESTSYEKISEILKTTQVESISVGLEKILQSSSSEHREELSTSPKYLYSGTKTSTKNYHKVSEPEKEMSVETPKNDEISNRTSKYHENISGLTKSHYKFSETTGYPEESQSGLEFQTYKGLNNEHSSKPTDETRRKTSEYYEDVSTLTKSTEVERTSLFSQEMYHRQGISASTESGKYITISGSTEPQTGYSGVTEIGISEHHNKMSESKQDYQPSKGTEGTFSSQSREWDSNYSKLNENQSETAVQVSTLTNSKLEHSEIEQNDNFPETTELEKTSPISARIDYYQVTSEPTVSESYFFESKGISNKASEMSGSTELHALFSEDTENKISEHYEVTLKTKQKPQSTMGTEVITFPDSKSNSLEFEKTESQYSDTAMMTESSKMFKMKTESGAKSFETQSESSESTESELTSKYFEADNEMDYNEIPSKSIEHETKSTESEQSQRNEGSFESADFGLKSSQTIGATGMETELKAEFSGTQSETSDSTVSKSTSNYSSETTGGINQVETVSEPLTVHTKSLEFNQTEHLEGTSGSADTELEFSETTETTSKAKFSETRNEITEFHMKTQGAIEYNEKTSETTESEKSTETEHYGKSSELNYSEFTENGFEEFSDSQSETRSKTTSHPSKLSEFTGYELTSMYPTETLGTMKHNGDTSQSTEAETKSAESTQTEYYDGFSESIDFISKYSEFTQKSNKENEFGANSTPEYFTVTQKEIENNEETFKSTESGESSGTEKHVETSEAIELATKSSESVQIESEYPESTEVTEIKSQAEYSETSSEITKKMAEISETTEFTRYTEWAKSKTEFPNSTQTEHHEESPELIDSELKQGGLTKHSEQLTEPPEFDIISKYSTEAKGKIEHNEETSESTELNRESPKSALTEHHEESSVSTDSELESSKATESFETEAGSEAEFSGTENEIITNPRISETPENNEKTYESIDSELKFSDSTETSETETGAEVKFSETESDTADDQVKVSQPTEFEFTTEYFTKKQGVTEQIEETSELIESETEPPESTVEHHEESTESTHFGLEISEFTVISETETEPSNSAVSEKETQESAHHEGSSESTDSGIEFPEITKTSEIETVSEAQSSEVKSGKTKKSTGTPDSTKTESAVFAQTEHHDGSSGLNIFESAKTSEIESVMTENASTMSDSSEFLSEYSTEIQNDNNDTSESIEPTETMYYEKSESADSVLKFSVSTKISGTETESEVEFSETENAITKNPAEISESTEFELISNYSTGIKSEMEQNEETTESSEKETESTLIKHHEYPNSTNYGLEMSVSTETSETVTESEVEFSQTESEITIFEFTSELSTEIQSEMEYNEETFGFTSETEFDETATGQNEGYTELNSSGLTDISETKSRLGVEFPETEVESTKNPAGTSDSTNFEFTSEYSTGIEINGETNETAESATKHERSSEWTDYGLGLSESMETYETEPEFEVGNEETRNSAGISEPSEFEVTSDLFTETQGEKEKTSGMKESETEFPESALTGSSESTDSGFIFSTVSETEFFGARSESTKNLTETSELPEFTSEYSTEIQGEIKHNEISESESALTEHHEGSSGSTNNGSEFPESTEIAETIIASEADSSETESEITKNTTEEDEREYYEETSQSSEHFEEYSKSIDSGTVTESEVEFSETGSEITKKPAKISATPKFEFTSENFTDENYEIEHTGKTSESEHYSESSESIDSGLAISETTENESQTEFLETQNKITEKPTEISESPEFEFSTDFFTETHGQKEHNDKISETTKLESESALTEHHRGSSGLSDSGLEFSKSTEIYGIETASETQNETKNPAGISESPEFGISAEFSIVTKDGLGDNEESPEPTEPETEYPEFAYHEESTESIDSGLEFSEFTETSETENKMTSRFATEIQSDIEQYDETSESIESETKSLQSALTEHHEGFSRASDSTLEFSESTEKSANESGSETEFSETHEITKNPEEVFKLPEIESTSEYYTKEQSVTEQNEGISEASELTESEAESPKSEFTKYQEESTESTSGLELSESAETSETETELMSEYSTEIQGEIEHNEGTSESIELKTESLQSVPTKHHEGFPSSSNSELKLSKFTETSAINTGSEQEFSETQNGITKNPDEVSETTEIKFSSEYFTKEQSVTEQSEESSELPQSETEFPESALTERHEEPTESTESGLEFSESAETSETETELMSGYSTEIQGEIEHNEGTSESIESETESLQSVQTKHHKGFSSSSDSELKLSDFTETSAINTGSEQEFSETQNEITENPDEVSETTEIKFSSEYFTKKQSVTEQSEESSELPQSETEFPESALTERHEEPTESTESGLEFSESAETSETETELMSRYSTEIQGEIEHNEETSESIESETESLQSVQTKHHEVYSRSTRLPESTDTGLNYPESIETSETEGKSFGTEGEITNESTEISRAEFEWTSKYRTEIRGETEHNTEPTKFIESVTETALSEHEEGYLESTSLEFSESLSETETELEVKFPSTQSEKSENLVEISTESMMSQYSKETQGEIKHSEETSTLTGTKETLKESVQIKYSKESSESTDSGSKYQESTEVSERETESIEKSVETQSETTKIPAETYSENEKIGPTELETEFPGSEFPETQSQTTKKPAETSELTEPEMTSSEEGTSMSTESETIFHTEVSETEGGITEYSAQATEERGYELLSKYSTKTLEGIEHGEEEEFPGSVQTEHHERSSETIDFELESSYSTQPFETETGTEREFFMTESDKTKDTAKSSLPTEFELTSEYLTKTRGEIGQNEGTTTELPEYIQKKHHEESSESTDIGLKYSESFETSESGIESEEKYSQTRNDISSYEEMSSKTTEVDLTSERFTKLESTEKEFTHVVETDIETSESQEVTLEPKSKSSEERESEPIGSTQTSPSIDETKSKSEETESEFPGISSEVIHDFTKNVKVESEFPATDTNEYMRTESVNVEKNHHRTIEMTEQTSESNESDEQSTLENLESRSETDSKQASVEHDEGFSESLEDDTESHNTKEAEISTHSTERTSGLKKSGKHEDNETENDEGFSEPPESDQSISTEENVVHSTESQSSITETKKYTENFINIEPESEHSTETSYINEKTTKTGLESSISERIANSMEFRNISENTKEYEGDTTQLEENVSQSSEYKTKDTKTEISEDTFAQLLLFPEPNQNSNLCEECESTVKLEDSTPREVIEISSSKQMNEDVETRNFELEIKKYHGETTKSLSSLAYTPKSENTKKSTETKFISSEYDSHRLFNFHEDKESSTLCAECEKITTITKAENTKRDEVITRSTISLSLDLDLEADRETSGLIETVSSEYFQTSITGGGNISGSTSSKIEFSEAKSEHGATIEPEKNQLTSEYPESSMTENQSPITESESMSESKGLESEFHGERTKSVGENSESASDFSQSSITEGINISGSTERSETESVGETSESIESTSEFSQLSTEGENISELMSSQSESTEHGETTESAGESSESIESTSEFSQSSTEGENISESMSSESESTEHSESSESIKSTSEFSQLSTEAEYISESMSSESKSTEHGETTESAGESSESIESTSEFSQSSTEGENISESMSSESESTEHGESSESIKSTSEFSQLSTGAEYISESMSSESKSTEHGETTESASESSESIEFTSEFSQSSTKGENISESMSSETEYTEHGQTTESAGGSSESIEFTSEFSQSSTKGENISESMSSESESTEHGESSESIKSTSEFSQLSTGAEYISESMSSESKSTEHGETTESASESSESIEFTSEFSQSSTKGENISESMSSETEYTEHGQTTESAGESSESIEFTSEFSQSSTKGENISESMSSETEYTEHGQTTESAGGSSESIEFTSEFSQSSTKGENISEAMSSETESTEHGETTESAGESSKSIESTSEFSQSSTEGENILESMSSESESTKHGESSELIESASDFSQSSITEGENISESINSESRSTEHGETTESDNESSGASESASEFLQSITQGENISDSISSESESIERVETTESVGESSGTSEWASELSTVGGPNMSESIGSELESPEAESKHSGITESVTETSKSIEFASDFSQPSTTGGENMSELISLETESADDAERTESVFEYLQSLTEGVENSSKSQSPETETQHGKTIEYFSESSETTESASEAIQSPTTESENISETASSVHSGIIEASSKISESNESISRTTIESASEFSEYLPIKSETGHLSNVTEPIGSQSDIISKGPIEVTEMGSSKHNIEFNESTTFQSNYETTGHGETKLEEHYSSSVEGENEATVHHIESMSTKRESDNEETLHTIIPESTHHQEGYQFEESTKSTETTTLSLEVTSGTTEPTSERNEVRTSPETLSEFNSETKELEIGGEMLESTIGEYELPKEITSSGSVETIEIGNRISEHLEPSVTVTVKSNFDNVSQSEIHMSVTSEEAKENQLFNFPKNDITSTLCKECESTKAKHHEEGTHTTREPHSSTHVNTNPLKSNISSTREKPTHFEETVTEKVSASSKVHETNGNEHGISSASDEMEKEYTKETHTRPTTEYTEKKENNEKIPETFSTTKRAEMEVTAEVEISEESSKKTIPEEKHLTTKVEEQEENILNTEGEIIEHITERSSHIHLTTTIGQESSKEWKEEMEVLTEIGVEDDNFIMKTATEEQNDTSIYVTRMKEVTHTGLVTSIHSQEYPETHTKTVVVIVNNSGNKIGKINETVLEKLLNKTRSDIDLEYIDYFNISKDSKNHPNISSDVEISKPLILKGDGKACTQREFNANKNCICDIDSYVSQIQGTIANDQKVDVTHYNCSKLVSFHDGIIINNQTQPLKRKRRSLLYMNSIGKALNYIENDDIESVFDDEYDLQMSDSNIFVYPGSKVNIFCHNKADTLLENKGASYSWTFRNDSSTEGDALPANENPLVLQEVDIKNAGNYTCIKTEETGSKEKFDHELELVTFPVYKIKTIIFYAVNDSCSLSDGDLLYSYLPKLFSPILCGASGKLCKVDVERPHCFTDNENNLFNVSVIATMNDINHIFPTIDETRCNINCKLKTYNNMVGLVNKNAAILKTLPVFSKISPALDFLTNITPTERKYEVVKHPKLITVCKGGYGVEKLKQRICVVCPKHTFSGDDEAFCKMCPAGQYQTQPGSKACIPCSSPVDDTMCLRMLYSDTKLFKIYVGAAFGFVLLLIVVIVLWNTNTNRSQKRNFEGSLKHRSMRRKKITDAENPALEPLLKNHDDNRQKSPPQVPPPDF